ncbi:MAG: Asp-tRNA(Asn)/Glu-tRNA(Gln) amidotransferase subunit GatA [Heliobacteriaceae bacterium]|nr:Asp-tRNA(Asn)/Glu-tRNA(Gln) amidotransferase subunit GatA [Heliobacteriaceae bacterium]MDD4588044.1 Asp-tRNA(Asn)/Glu-tRNA(Gln) amidotransferase subunit GatA [Heliobacteriaceae bacterium]
MNDLHTKTAHELHGLLGKKAISATELTRALIERNQAAEPLVQAFITPTPEIALAEATRVDARLHAGEPVTPLAGVPLAYKDNICTAGVRTTCASKMLANFVPPYDATAVAKLKATGAVMLGKLNMDEFALGASTENSAFFPSRNPWDRNRVPGGSSGGAAAAVAAGEVVYALGSDTGGSVRQPAAFCGIVGLKPTYGAVSRYGVVSVASSLDQVGTLTRDVRDCALVLNAICGQDPLDSTSAPVEHPDYTALLGQPVTGWRIGIPKEYLGAELDPQVRAILENAVKVLTGLGAEVAECSLPHTEYSLPVYSLITAAEVSSNLARYDGVRFGLRVEEADLETMFRKTRAAGFGPEVKRRILLGTHILSAGYYEAYYLEALKVRTLIRRDFDQVFRRFDLLLSPTSPTVAFKFGERSTDTLETDRSGVYTLAANLAGIPAISVNGGFAAGLPVGVQFMGKPFAEPQLLQVAYAFEQATQGHRPLPDLGV